MLSPQATHHRSGEDVLPTSDGASRPSSQRSSDQRPVRTFHELQCFPAGRDTPYSVAFRPSAAQRPSWCDAGTSPSLRWEGRCHPWICRVLSPQATHHGSGEDVPTTSGGASRPSSPQSSAYSRIEPRTSCNVSLPVVTHPTALGPNRQPPSAPRSAMLGPVPASDGKGDVTHGFVGCCRRRRRTMDLLRTFLRRAMVRHDRRHSEAATNGRREPFTSCNVSLPVVTHPTALRPDRQPPSAPRGAMLGPVPASVGKGDVTHGFVGCCRRRRRTMDLERTSPRRAVVRHDRLHHRAALTAGSNLARPAKFPSRS
ncbi:hypothetical protein Mal4_25200 [Maioricimonas rarisocia]|uniref:Uncharacterized protein n=1 Tax=Maioricimonas rarisocia TaxID=2528026 RepID=A0A517Z6T6_9PLAN|nr:hypothetical protein Mal4_25200 [Maioricimonas rarisocia]